MGFEIAEQLGWTLPDVILYPTGGGVGLIGIYKALRELQELGWVQGPLPRLVAVQASGCAPIVQAWQQGERESRFWPDSQTLAFGINVPKALGDFLVLDALYRTEGCAVAVEDGAIQRELRQLASQEGCFVCPEGAAAFAAAASCGKRAGSRGASGWWCSTPAPASSTRTPSLSCPSGCAATGGSRHELRLVLCSHHPAGVRPIGLDHPAARRHRDPHLARRGAAQCDAAKPAQALAERGDPRLCGAGPQHAALDPAVLSLLRAAGARPVSVGLCHGGDRHDLPRRRLPD